MNLYGFVGNDGVSWIDILGAKKLTFQYDLAKETEVRGDEFKAGAVAVTDFNDMLDRAKEAVGKYHKDGKDPCNCIELLRIGGHGGKGKIHRGNLVPATGANSLSTGAWNTLDIWTKASGGELTEEFLEQRAEGGVFSGNEFDSIEAMKSLAGLMCEGGKLELVSCQTGKGVQGESLKGRLEGLYGAGNVTLYDCNVTWSSEGVKKVKGNGEKIR